VNPHGAAATAPIKPTSKSKPKVKPGTKRKVKRDPVKVWTNTLNRYRPKLMEDTLLAMRSMYGVPEWQPFHDPTTELVLTMLTANSADINAEKAFDAMCRRWPARSDRSNPGAQVGYRKGWGGVGIQEPEADWAAVADAPIDELIDVIRPGGLAPTKAPRIQAVLRHLSEERGDFSLSFLGEMAPADALAWLTAVPGIGRKTASVVLMFAFNMPLMAVDRHIERVAKRIGLVPTKATAEQAHDYLQAQLADGQVHEAHVNLITHGRQTCDALRPQHERCAIAARCRYFNAKAP
jgi:endonuclease III